MSNQPPLGIMPEWRWRELRALDLAAAIERALNSDRPVFPPWIGELREQLEWLSRRESIRRI